MKKVLKFLIFVFILFIIWHQYGDTIRADFFPVLNAVMREIGLGPKPCEKPIPYNIGTFATEFNISQDYFLSAMSDAEAIWEKPFGKELFTYDKGGEGYGVLKVNLIYDYRQQATNKLGSLGIQVDNNKASYDDLKAKFTALNAEFSEEKTNYEANVQSFNAAQKTYEQEVKYWNSRGGAPKKEYDDLQAEKAELDKKYSELKTEEKKINDMVAEINSMVVVLNSLAKTLNISVDNYNTVGASRGESFEEGVYSSDGLSAQIDIYEFSNRAKLVRVLAHELGHALGLEHVDDPKAIMYAYNQGSSETLAQADLTALKTLCGAK